ncbi:MAG: NAD(P)(+) transhydrogenase (Re/Si-specific) subunit beta [Myxococcota bacterium]|jgi:NAD(P) transhydrogenase subunit beta|nr:NAD(P)(+) transhydrogenase (Re/Si-specific) subunit beta [Myxococcota bacterium]
MIENLTSAAYLAAGALFIFALRWMSHPKTARRGVFAGVLGMTAAVGGTLLHPEIVGFEWIALAVVIGTAIGIPLSRVALTAVPQRTAISHAFGGLAAGLVGTAKYILWMPEGELTPFRTGAISLEVILGFLTFTGSLMAAGKLQEWIPTRPITYRGQNVINLGMLGVALLAAVVLVIDPTQWFLFPLLVILSLLFGVMLILPIGGADMPTVISLLNSYAGLAAVAMGYVLENKVLIIAGALDGASGLILSIIMCRAMNRSFSNVLFGAFGQVAGGPATAAEAKPVKSATAQDVAELLELAREVVVVPGYGLAVAQAQHRAFELYEQLTKRGIRCRFAIHPVAGRMPGHMNVLLAEANVPYDALVEMDDINPDLGQVDVAIVVGANDVVNPAARHDKSSPIYGMPIIDVDKCKTVIANKRTMNPGFAGIDNELYTADNTLMLFGDAKAALGDVVKALAGESGMGH